MIDPSMPAPAVRQRWTRVSWTLYALCGALAVWLVTPDPAVRAQQAARDPTTIRCPRDGAVMRVLGGRAPASGEPLDLECPACRRRAVGVRPADSAATPLP